MIRVWTSEGGHRLTLYSRPGVRFSLTLYDADSRVPVFYREYSYWERGRAESEAEALASLGRMREGRVREGAH